MSCIRKTLERGLKPSSSNPFFSSSPRKKNRHTSLFALSGRFCSIPPPASRKGIRRSGAMGEQVVTEQIQRKLEEVNATVQQHLAGVQDHINFTMQVRGFGGGSRCPASVSCPRTTLAAACPRRAVPHLPSKPPTPTSSLRCFPSATSSPDLALPFLCGLVVG
jgi:hypothetical protein